MTTTTTTTAPEKSMLVIAWEAANSRLEKALEKLNTSSSNAYKGYRSNYGILSNKAIAKSLEEYIESQEAWIEMAKEAHEEVQALNKIGGQDAYAEYLCAVWDFRKNSK